MKIISWNIARREEAWQALSDSGADIALLQEANNPPQYLSDRIKTGDSLWTTVGAGYKRNWRTVVVQLNDSLDVKWFRPNSIENAKPGELAVSQLGTLAAAIITPSHGEPIIVVSIYGLWQSPHAITESDWIISDVTVHRLISDLSLLIGKQNDHRLIVAGDLNLLYGYGENGNSYWASRYKTVFDRMEVIGLDFVGPQAPEGGRQAEPRPKELPADSMNVPTYHSNKMTPAQATRQLDYVFASKSISKSIKVRALNSPEEWGPSDHCRIEITLST